METLAKRYLKWVMMVVAWITVLPDILNGITLSSDKFQNNLHMCFGMGPLGLLEQMHRLQIKSNNVSCPALLEGRTHFFAS